MNRLSCLPHVAVLAYLDCNFVRRLALIRVLKMFIWLLYEGLGYDPSCCSFSVRRICVSPTALRRLSIRLCGQCAGFAFWRLDGAYF